MKNSLVQQNSMTLVVIPCWWDGTIDSLSGAIHFQRPDLVINASRNIPLNPPLNFFQQHEIPMVGELMLASFPTSSSFDEFSSAWWLGEKYDGIRCCWNPVTETLYSRTGKEIQLFPPLTSSFPNSFVDGELWAGRGNYSVTNALAQGSIDFSEWATIRMVAFDNPLSNALFEERYANLVNVITSDPFMVIAARVQCIDGTLVTRAADFITGSGGEGVVLRKYASPYVHGRNSYLFKLKEYQSDCEAVVTEIDQSNSVHLMLPNGNSLIIAHENVLVPDLAIGNIVSVLFARRGERESPKIFRIRTDLTWDYVMSNYRPEQIFLNNEKLSTDKNHGEDYVISEVREKLINYVVGKGLSPFSPNTWYSISYDEIKRAKGVGPFMNLSRFQGNYLQTLKCVFPELELDIGRFQVRYDQVENRKKFFETYAREKNFDPYMAGNWYSQDLENVYHAKGASGVLSYHNQSVVKALLDLFPNIGLDKSRFRVKPLWWEPARRRNLFENYAKANHFDANVPENWYFYSKAKIRSFPRARLVLSYYRGSIPRALVDLFPDIGLDIKKFRPEFSSRMSTSERRKIFEIYARQNKFDPLVPANWYTQPRKKILSFQGMTRAIFHHERSYSKALMDLFPNIGLVKSRFPRKRPLDTT
eukprot:Phypoly_transcript_03973.p1 GENE.Phypoly_transcript_03973~~Phypoly_transcript_03973.p1  ORF type:complete len:646 (+),score=59.16 Phypoly_transcript_03973:3-1940(+)